MCRYCRHPEGIKAVERKLFGLYGVPKTRSEIEVAIVLIGRHIRKLKDDRKLLDRRRESTWEIDAERDELHFAAMVLNVSLGNIKNGEHPWLNGGRLWTFRV